MVAWSDLNLADAHIDMLVGAGITPQLAKRRGYWTAYQSDVAKLRNVLGFADWQTPRAAFPALVLPMFPPGESTRTPATAQIRPAMPRSKGKGKEDGKPSKEKDEELSTEGVAFAYLMRGVHW